MADQDDFAGFNLPSASQMKDLRKPVAKAVQLLSQIEQAEAMLVAWKTEYNFLSGTIIPTAMKAVGLNYLSTDDGAEIEIKDFISGTLPKDPRRRDLALKWLEKNEGRDLIKQGIDVHLDRGDEKAADAVKGWLDKNGLPYDVEVGVHPSTLAAYARERMKAGKEVDLDCLGLFAGSVAKIKLAKKVKQEKKASEPSITTPKKALPVPPKKMEPKKNSSPAKAKKPAAMAKMVRRAA